MKQIERNICIQKILFAISSGGYVNSVNIIHSQHILRNYPFKTLAFFLVSGQKLDSSKKLPTEVGRGQKSWIFADVLNGWSLISGLDQIWILSDLYIHFLTFKTRELSLLVMKNIMAKFWEAIIESCVLNEKFPFSNHFKGLRYKIGVRLSSSACLTRWNH